MMAKSVRPALMRPCSASHATPAKPPLSSSTVPLISTLPFNVDAGAADRFRGEHRRGDSRLHVARAASPDPPVAHDPAERIHRPAGAGGDDVEVAVQVDERAQRASAPGADDVDARMGARVLGPPFRRVILDVEAERRERRRR